MPIASLYELSFPNGKRYVGIAGCPERRMAQHWKDSGRMRTPVQKAFRHFGKSAVKMTVLAVGNRDYILDLEVKAIAAFGTRVPNGYNVSFGGEISPMMSPESRAKRGATVRGRGFSPAHIAALSAAQIGRKHSEETKAKMRLAQKGRVISLASREKQRIAMTGRVHTEEAKRKMSESRTGTKRSDETRSRMRAAWVRRKERELSDTGA